MLNFCKYLGLLALILWLSPVPLVGAGPASGGYGGGAAVLAAGLPPASSGGEVRAPVDSPAAGLLLFTPSTMSIELPQGRKREMKVYLNNSDEDPVQVRLTASTDGVVPSWLFFNGQLLPAPEGVGYNLGAVGNELFFTVDALSLPEGTYQALVLAEASGYQTAELVITLQVSNFDEGLRPHVTEVRPADGTTNVRLDQSISVDLAFPSGKSIDGSTVHGGNVKLFRVAGDKKTEVPGAIVNTTAAGDAITLSAPLEPSHLYEFLISEGVKDGNGYAMIPFTSRFTTAASTQNTPTDLTGVSFTEQILIGASFGSDGFTSLVVGPDRRLYATTSGGKIERWDIAPNGTLRNHTSFSPFGSTRRLLIGFAFDPAATAGNLVAWISHSAPEYNEVDDWTGKVSRVDLGDPTNLQIQDYLIHLPRSIKDHATNGVAFGPDRALYILQGGNNAMGAPDDAWGRRPERLLTAALLRLDISRAAGMPLPIDVKTEEGGTYDPYSPQAPLTLYATGIRNAYDLVWHSNGKLFVPTNGSAAGGNTPTLNTGERWSNGEVYAGPTVAGLQNVRATQNDFLFRVEAGGYYGHPNPRRNEFIMNGGNPTAGQDPGEVTWVSNGRTFGYPVGTPPEPNYRGWAYDFGLNKSPNGVIEYKSNAFGGKLKGKLLICRFSGGDDIMVLEPGSNALDILAATEGSQIPGFRRPFANPLDLTEDPATGNIYLSEYFDGNGDGRPRITLLRATQPASAEAFTLALETVGAGVVNQAPGQINYAAGSQVTLSAVPAPGFEFAGWGGDANGTTNPLSLSMNGNKKVSALFRKEPATDGITRINAGGTGQNINGAIWVGCPDPITCNGYVLGGTSYTKSPSPEIMGLPLDTETNLFLGNWTDEQNGGPNSLAFTYNIPVMNGPYQVRLFFAELDQTGPGQRIFDVHLEGGSSKLQGLDVYQAAQGANRVLVKELATYISDGTVTLDFIRQVGHPFVSAIEIVPAGTSVGLPGQAQPARPRLSVYPNPSPKEQATVHLTGFGGHEPVRVTVHDLAGRVLLSLLVVTDRDGAYVGQVPFGKAMAKGIYLLKAASATGHQSIKLLVE